MSAAEHPPAGSIVVGVDGSPASHHALRWAVGQAALERRPLVILHAMNLLGPGQRTGASLDAPSQLSHELTTGARGVLDEAVRRARHLAPRLDLYEVLSQADPRNALLAEAARATMVVVGSRGRGPVASLLLGSVSVAVSRHAGCPVVVVRPQEAAVVREGVLVGVDGTARDRDVVAFAFQLASQRAMSLTVVHCFWDATHLGRDEQQVTDDEAGLDDERLRLREAVRSMSQTFPDVRPRLELARGFADRRLIERSRVMDLVVVGWRRSGSPTRAFSSIAPAVVEHARCAVAVVPLTGRAWT